MPYTVSKSIEESNMVDFVNLATVKGNSKTFSKTRFTSVRMKGHFIGSPVFL